ncbi:MAG: alpha-L-arabinofuranosidase C-terminal domain-containing protein [Planctomycetota bacterium]
MKLTPCAIVLSSLASLAGGEPPSLTIHAGKPAHKIPASLYGIFFEEINHAGDGGLYSELVRNRSFEEPTGPGGEVPGWSALATAGATKPGLTIDTARPQNSTAPRALRVVLDGAPATIVNEGFWGMSLLAGESYRLRFDARVEGAVDGALTVALRDKGALAVAEQSIKGLTGDWKRFEVELKVTRDVDAGTLAIVCGGKGSIWFDTVSLSPVHTWKDRPLGMRRDLGELVSGLSPNFVRFPGGCYVEGGDLLKDAFRWKDTLGDIGERPGHLNATWNYWSSDGLGYHEYLQWCEDLHADPMFVVNCGLSHKEIVAMDKLGPWVQDCLDAIEYANGGVDTRWGAVRAANGHPASFKLKYVEIGNENGMWTGFGGTRAVYAERYKVFYDAIKKAYPEIITISNTRVDMEMELVDDHYYNSPEWFWSNANLYDKAPRTGPRVYVGEYAVTQGCGTGNLAAALGEAAFMTGMERNSDLVAMSSYAPMFVHAKDRKWNPDIMVFDGARSYGTPSYHVQALFAAHRPDTLLPVDIPRIEAKPVALRGGIGLGTWRTQAEFKDIVVESGGKAVYSSDFARSTQGWKPASGEWKVVDGAYRQSAQGEKEVALLDWPALRDAVDYTVRLKARKIAGDEGFLILFRAPGADNCTWWNIGGWGNRQHAVEKTSGASKFGVGEHVAGAVETGRWHDITIELAGNSIRCSLDGRLIQEVQERSMPAFTGVAGRVAATGEIVVKIVNGMETAAPVRIVIDSGEQLDPVGESIVLTSSGFNDENTFEAPERIAPRRARLTGVGASFVHEFPARSLTVLRLRPQRDQPASGR